MLHSLTYIRRHSTLSKCCRNDSGCHTVPRRPHSNLSIMSRESPRERLRCLGTNSELDH
ncbi:hypothetical protein B0H17DRAFT_1105538 [Mycena rosella]|uniref:Uncharacterized protein n=1 Tax=Mycena rosella TaxID=1033263 RepID=A0AAD7FUX0_MYCRO|nr:hypothetical protein B0H17DRAFT_1105538 [Mycena rosella]